MSSLCPHRWAGGKHKFEPRYDKSTAEVPEGFKFEGPGDAANVMETLRRVTYVRDVCVNCGATVERKA